MAKIQALFVMALLLLSTFATSFADVENNDDLEIYMVKLNGDDLSWGYNPVDFGDKLNLRIGIRSYDEFKDVKLTAFLTTEYDQEKAMDTTSMFDMTPYVDYKKDLEISIPETMQRDAYTLTVMVSDKTGIIFTESLDLVLESSETHQLKIKDVVITPESIKAGRQIKVKAQLENLGKVDEKDVKVTASVLKDGQAIISDSDYIDVIHAEDSEESNTEYSEPIYLSIDKCVEAGNYDLKVKATYSSGKKSVEKTTPITIVASDACSVNVKSEDKLTVSISDKIADVKDGAAEFAIALSNTGDTSKTVFLEANANWANVKFEPTQVVSLEKGQVAMVKMSVTPQNGIAAGAHSFVLTVKTGDGASIAQETLTVDVSGSNASISLRNALEVGLVVVIILLAILGLIIGFSKLKGAKEDESDEEMTSQTYY